MVVFISFPSAFCSVYVRPRQKIYFINHCFFQQDLYFLLMTFFSTNNFLLMKLLPIHCSWGAPFSEKRPKLQVTDYITKKVDFRNNGFRAKMRHVWRLASWGMAFLLKQVCSRTTFVYHKKSEWERYKTYPVDGHGKEPQGGVIKINLLSVNQSG